MELTSNDILLEYAKERYSNKDLPSSFSNHRKQQVYDFKPSDFGDFPKDENELKKCLKREWKHHLVLLGSFFEEYKAITSNYLKNPDHPVTILNLSTTNHNLCSIYRNKMTVSRVLGKLRLIKGLVMVDKKFRFGCRSRIFNTSRVYAYNKSIEKLVLSTISKYSLILKSPGIQNHDNPGMDIPLGNTFRFDPERYFKVGVSSKLKIPRMTDGECKAILTRKYGKLIEPRLKKIEEMNKSLPKEQRIVFDWNIHRSKTGFITKIGIRATSSLASLKEHNNENSGYTGRWRKDYLDERFGSGKWFEFDVHGSIFQITRLLNYGEWFGEGDPYEVMFGEKFRNQEDRMAYKSICMPLYFDRPNSIIPHNAKKTPEVLKKYDRTGLQPVINNAEDSMYGFTGRKLDSEVFLHESLLYVDFVDQLRKRGIDVVQVYDGFYMRIGSIYPDELESIMEGCAMRYYEEYRNWFVRKHQSALRIRRMSKRCLIRKNQHRPTSKLLTLKGK